MHLTNTYVHIKKCSRRLSMEDLDELIEEMEFINLREKTVEDLLNEKPKEAYRVNYQ